MTTAPTSRSLRGPGVRGWVANVGGSVIDQGLSSATQFLLIIGIAHVESAATFGTASAVVILHGLLLGLQRAGLGDVALLRCRRLGVAVPEVVRAGLGASLGYGIVVALALAAAGLALGQTAGTLLLVLAAVTPAIYLQDMLRSLAFGRRRVGWAVGLDANWLGVQLVGFGILLVAGAATAASLIAVWGLGAVGSVAIGLTRRGYKPSARAARTWASEDAARSRAFSVDYLSDFGITMVASLGVGALLGPADFGAYRLAVAAVMPPTNLMGSVRSLVLGRIAEYEATPRRAERTAMTTASGFLSLAVVYGVLLAALPTEAGARLFGGTWGDARPLIVAVAAAEALRFSSIPAIDLVRVLGRPTTLVRTRLTVTAISVTATLGGGFLFGLGVVWVVVASRTVGAMIWWSRGLRLTRGAPGAEGGPPSDDDDTGLQLSTTAGVGRDDERPL